MSRTYERDLEAMGHEPTKPRSLRSLSVSQVCDYILSSLISCAVVIVIYSGYMILWVRLTPTQFFLWIAGSIPMSLIFSWPIIRITLWAKRRLLRPE